MGKHKKKKGKKSKKRQRRNHSPSQSDSSTSSSGWQELRKETKKKERSRSSSEDSSVSACSWEELPRDNAKKNSDGCSSNKTKSDLPAEREDWLGDSDIFSVMGRDYREEKKEKHLERKEHERRVNLDKPGQHERELNPYWKDGGTGVPENEAGSSLEGNQVGRSSGRSLPAASSGHGQLQWLQRALKRLKEEASDTGVSIEELAKERWGSLSKLEGMIAEAEEKAGIRRGATTRQNYAGHQGNWSDRAQRHGHDLERADFRRRMRRPNSDDEEDHRRSSRSFARPRDVSEDEENRRRSDARRRDSGDQRRGRPHGYTSHRSEGERRSWRRDDAHRKSASPDGHRRREHGQTSRAGHSQGKHEVPARDQPKAPSPVDDRTENKTSEEAQPDEKKVLSDAELNKLAAKLLKAEMMNNTEQVAKLKKKIEVARKLREENPDEVKRASRQQQEIVVLTKTDSRGVSRPVQPIEEGSSEGPSRRKKTKADTHSSGERLRYFADDDRQSLNQMFEREKLSTAADDAAMFAKMAGRIKVKAGDEDYTVDDAFVDRAARSDESRGQKNRDANKAIQEHQIMQRVLETCNYCLESPACLKHLIVSVGSHAVLSLPPFQSLVEGHCLVTPTHHVPALSLADEDVWEEITKFRFALTKMFAENDEDCVFLETAMGLSSSRKPHAVLHCVPVPREVGNLLPMYYKKAILESETEWAQNKKLVDLSLKKGLRNSIPKGLPYFAVDFGTDHGFAHVIEDEREFPRHFGLEIVGGLLDCEPRLWLKKRNENFSEQSKKAVKFGKMWTPYEFNDKLL